MGKEVSMIPWVEDRGGQLTLYSWEYESKCTAISHSARLLDEEVAWYEIPFGEVWYRVSEHEASRFEEANGECGLYSCPIEVGTVWAYFHRSGSGVEQVRVYQGEEQEPLEVFGSFEEAEAWGQDEV